MYFVVDFVRGVFEVDGFFENVIVFVELDIFCLVVEGVCDVDFFGGVFFV